MFSECTACDGTGYQAGGSEHCTTCSGAGVVQVATTDPRPLRPGPTEGE